MRVHCGIRAIVVLAVGFLAIEPHGFAQNGAPASADELMTKVLASIQAKDKSALQQLTVTEAEFKKYVWPNLSALVRSAQSNADKFYKMFSTSSDAALDDLLRRHGGQNLTLVRASFGPESKHKGYRTLPNAEVAANVDGQDRNIRIASAVVEHDGVWKITSYFLSPTGNQGKQ